jgi:hypothetical protein
MPYSADLGLYLKELDRSIYTEYHWMVVTHRIHQLKYLLLGSWIALF